MIPDMVAMAPHLRRAGLVLVVVIALHGCTARPPDAGSSRGSVAERAQAEVPSGAISIGDQLYQVPIGVDADGCPRYRLYSPTRLVVQVIYYRDPAGGFTTDRQQARCAPGTPGGAGGGSR